MRLSELGSLGEFIASLATLVTLIYLARQIRDNSANLNRETQRATLADASAWRSHLIDSPELSEIYRVGITNPEELDPSERIRFRMLLHSLVEIWAFAYIHDENRLEAQEKFIIDTLSQPGGKLAWDGFKHAQSDEFKAYVSGLIGGSANDAQ